MRDSERKIALVTGGTRGIGKGIVIGLAKAGAIVYFTGRTEQEMTGAVQLSGSLSATEMAAEMYEGTTIGLKCDHTNDEDTKNVIEHIRQKHGRLDILVNNVWGGYEYFNNGTEFWKEKEFWTKPISRWDSMFNAGVRGYYVTTCFAAPLLISSDSSIVVNISFWVAKRNDRGVAYCTAKAATDKLTETMAYEFRSHNVAVVSLYPGLVRTESVMAAEDYWDLSNSESPEFTGKAILALADDPQKMHMSGQVCVVAQVALDYGFKDIDGRQPIPLTLETC